MKRIVEQPDLYLKGVTLQKREWHDNRAIDVTHVYTYDPETGDLVDRYGNIFDATITYNDKLSIMIDNISYDTETSEILSSAGNLHYKCLAVTGEGEIVEQGSVHDATRFTFKKYGKVWIQVYRDGGPCSKHPVTKEPLENGWFSQSKNLVIELSLNQKELLIQIVSDDSILRRNIGEPVPTTSEIRGLDYDVKILQDSDTLKVEPEIYFVYDSEDFYKTDILHHANNYSTYDNGVRYTKNPDNSWTIIGTANEGDSCHPLIVSSEQFPNYLVRDRKYQLRIEVLEGTAIPVEVEWFYTDSTVIRNFYTSTSTIQALNHYDEDSASRGVVLQGVRIRLFAIEGVSFNSIVKYSLLDIEERYMNNKVVSKYPVAAKGARIPILRDRDIFDIDFLENKGSESYSSNEVTFTKQYNLDTHKTTWKIQGTPTSDTYYDLVYSKEYLPKYMIPGTYLKLNKLGSSIDVVFFWYNHEKSLRLDIKRESSEILVPDEATGVVISILAIQGTSYNTTVSYTLGTKSNLNYKPKIRYKSAKLEFVNEDNYRIFTIYNDRMGEVDVVTYAKPYDVVRFTVTPYVGVTYKESSIRVSYYDEEGEQHSVSLNIEDTSYSFEMPVSNVEILVFFEYVAYPIDKLDGVSPYIDVGPYNSSRPIRISEADNEYWDALMFCYYARQKYFGEDELPLMQGIGGNRFYEEDSDSQTMPYLRRRDLVAVIHRISHMDPYSIPSGSTTVVAEYPREEPYLTTEVIVNPASTEFNNTIADQCNAPRTRLYKYARPRFDISSSYDPFDTDDVVYYGNMTYASSTTFSDPLNAVNGYARKNGFGNDDYLGAFSSFPDIDWATFIGIAYGYSELSFGPNTCCTFEEAAAMLWRYARFRQIDIRVRQDYSHLDEGVAYWAQRGPIQWVLSNGISTGYHMRTNRDPSSEQVKMKPSDLLNRAEFAYMVMKFCMLYAW